MRNHILSSLLVVCLCVMSVAAADDKTDERMLLTFIRCPVSPFYVGIDGGYFEEAGFTVTLEHLQEPDVLDLVAVGPSELWHRQRRTSDPWRAPRGAMSSTFLNGSNAIQLAWSIQAPWT